MKIDGKVILITGATGKLTRTIVKELANKHAKLALHYHTNHELAKNLQNQLKHTSIKLYSSDLTSTQNAQALAHSVLNDFKHIDILINTASTFPTDSLIETTDQTIEQTLTLNLKAPLTLAKALYDNFKSNPGVIINIADIWGIYPTNTFFAYSLAKSAMITLTKLLAQEFAPTTRVNAIAPGIIDFKENTSPTLREKLINRIPLARKASPQEIAKTTLFIIENDYITGQTLIIDGGRTLKI